MTAVALIVIGECDCECVSVSVCVFIPKNMVFAVTLFHCKFLIFETFFFFGSIL